VHSKINSSISFYFKKVMNYHGIPAHRNIIRMKPTVRYEHTTEAAIDAARARL
jgi:hypothetical protein